MLDSVLADFKSLVGSQDYNFKVGSFTFGLLKHFDLPDLASVVSPRPLWLLNPADAKGESLPLSALPSGYAQTATIRIELAPIDKAFREWVQSTLL